MRCDTLYVVNGLPYLFVYRFLTTWAFSLLCHVAKLFPHNNVSLQYHPSHCLRYTSFFLINWFFFSIWANGGRNGRIPAHRLDSSCNVIWLHCSVALFPLRLIARLMAIGFFSHNFFNQTLTTIFIKYIYHTSDVHNTYRTVTSLSTIFIVFWNAISEEEVIEAGAKEQAIGRFIKYCMPLNWNWNEITPFIALCRKLNITHSKDSLQFR